MKSLLIFLLGTIVGAALLLAGALGLFGQGERSSNTPETSDTDR